MNRFFALIILTLFISISPDLASANSNEKDSIQIKAIPLSNVSYKLSVDTTNISTTLQDLISQAEIDTISVHNNNILTLANKGLIKIDSIITHTQSIRVLDDSRTALVSYKSSIEYKRVEIKNALNDIENHIQDFTLLLKEWGKTKEDNTDATPVILERIDQAIDAIKKGIKKLEEKNNALLIEIDKNMHISLLLEGKIKDIEKALEKREDPFQGQKDPSIFSLNYTGSWDIINPSVDFFNKSIARLTRYFSNRLGKLLLTFILFIFFLVIFNKCRSRFEAYKLGFGEWYKRHLNLILRKPISAALIFTIFISFIIFFDRPLILRDIFGYMIIIPLVEILKTLVDKRFYKIINALPFLMVLYTFYVIYTPESIVFRLALLLMAAYQIFLLYSLHKELKSTSISHIWQKRAFHFIVYIQLLGAIISFISSTLGYVIISQSLMFAVYSNIVFGCSIFICAVIINGFLLNIIESRSVQSSFNFIALFEKTLKVKFVKTINFFASLAWIYLFFSAINKQWIIISFITKFFTTEHNIGSITFTVGNILEFFIVIYLAVFISNIVRIILEEGILNKMSLSKGLPHTIAIMTRYAIITLGVVLAFSITGVETTKFMVVLSAFGVGIGFGLQNIFNNLVSGFILLFERPIQLGDMIEVGTLLGKVKSIGIRSSNIETVDGAEVIVPNGQLVSTEVVNWTLSDKKRRIEILLGISYNADPHLVKKLITEVLESHNDILEDPGFSIYFVDYGASSLDFRVLFWTSDFSQSLSLRSTVVFEIYDIFKLNNIEIPFPQRDLHIRSIENLKIKRNDSGDFEITT